MVDLMTSDSRFAWPSVSPGFLRCPTRRCMTLRALTDAGLVRRIQPSGSVGGGTLERYNGANFKI
jgi:hypothetical protein